MEVEYLWVPPRLSFPWNWILFHWRFGWHPMMSVIFAQDSSLYSSSHIDFCSGSKEIGEPVEMVIKVFKVSLVDPCFNCWLSAIIRCQFNAYIFSWYSVDMYVIHPNFIYIYIVTVSEWIISWALLVSFLIIGSVHPLDGCNPFEYDSSICFFIYIGRW